MAEPSRLYFRQLLAGLDVAETDPVAQQMVNFIYLIGDRETGEAVIVDPAYDPAGIIAVAEADGMKVVGALGTHYHADHVGGSLGGMAEIVGIAELLEQVQVPIHVQADEIPWITRTTSVTADHLVGHASGDTVMVGEIPITLIHTPGHTPGSQCFLVDGRLVAGDTLFLDGCGRTDLPGSDPEQMYLSLTQRLAQVPDDAVLFPGHLYSEKPSATMAETRSRNVVFRPQSLEQWLMMFAR
ncbi:MAG TPA: MBL fold metallo-hydrolase [Acidimicrobiales bacterium]|jgi:hydroxyacylglutathione hydrolase|nr:MBL fold metallo-hydrolase [Acidimicrobiales bacterium]HRA33974.1 MBL fold metallo-hydrolase [Acidimicrobiales bacterium]